MALWSLSLYGALSRHKTILHRKRLAKAAPYGRIFILLIFLISRASSTDHECYESKRYNSEMYNSREFVVAADLYTNTSKIFLSSVVYNLITPTKPSNSTVGSELKAEKMPGNHSFLKATIEAGGGKKLRKLSGTDDDERSEKAKKKRNRKVAQLNSTINESILEKTAKERRTNHDKPRNDNDSPMSEEAEEWVRLEEKFSVHSASDIDKKLAAKLGHISEVTKRMHGKLRQELQELDEQNSPTLPSHNNTLTPKKDERSDRNDDNKFFPTRTVEEETPSGISSGFLSMNHQIYYLTYVVAHTRPGSVVQSIRKRVLEPAASIYVPINKRMMFNDEVRHALEKRIKRDTEWPVKVGIFATQYQTGDEKFLLNLSEKDEIGKFIGTSLKKLAAQNLKGNVSSEIEIHDELRLSAGMAVINCKNDKSAKWLTRLAASAKQIKSTMVRDHIELQAKTIKEAKPFKAFTIINTNKSDNWEATKALLAAKGVNVDGLVVVNTRSERNTVFTAVDIERKVHECFEVGKRLRNYNMLAGSVTVKLTYGEDEKCETIKVHGGQNNSTLFFLFQSLFPKARTNRLSHRTRRTISMASTGISQRRTTKCRFKLVKQRNASDTELRRTELKCIDIAEIECKGQKVVAKAREFYHLSTFAEFNRKINNVESQKVIQTDNRVSNRIKTKRYLGEAVRRL